MPRFTNLVTQQTSFIRVQYPPVCPGATAVLTSSASGEGVARASCLSWNDGQDARPTPEKGKSMHRSKGEPNP